MAKLYPPKIPSTIPAFIQNNRGTERATFSVPFFLNRMVGIDEIGGFILKIKSATSNKKIFTATARVWTEKEGSPGEWERNPEALVFNEETGSGVITFNIPLADYEKLYKGQFYKAQLANYKVKEYDESNLYFSDVSIVKMSGEVSQQINDLKLPQSESDKEYNFAIQKLTGTYSNTDITEKLYSSRFIIYDMYGEIFEDSGEIVQNNAIKGEIIYDNYGNPQYYKTTETYTRTREMIESEFYYVQWEYTTINGYQGKTAKYPITQKTITPELKAKLIAELNYDNGYINLRLQALEDENHVLKTEIGDYLVTRHSSKNPGEWLEIYRFDLREEIPTRQLWIDNTVEQGVTYTYGIQQYSKYGIFTSRIKSNAVVADFEHMYLSDEKRQLKVAFNPKVSSFKPTILETKTDTIGGKYPFIFRNGDVYYHELPISGLISCQLDDSNLFTSKNELDTIINKLELASDPSSTTIATERLFKREVLSWLTNGKPKLLRTPTEGNFIVRLMNVSLSPMDQLGRMLHTFSATAYEIEDYSFNNIVNMRLLNDLKEDIDTSFAYESLILTKTEEYKNEFSERQVPLTIGQDGSYTIDGAYSVQFSDMIPGTRFIISYPISPGEPEKLETTVNGFNQGDIKNNSDRVIFINNTGTFSYFSDSPFVVKGTKQAQTGMLTFSYKSQRINEFEKISNITVYFIDGKVFESNKGLDENIIDTQIRVKQDGKTFDPNKQATHFYRLNFYKKDDKVLSSDDYQVKITYLNDENPSLFNIYYYPIVLKDMVNIKSINIGKGVYADLSYDLIEITKKEE